VAPYDANIKDVDELITKKGPESIKKIIQDRTDFFTYLINYTFKKTLSQDQKLNELNSILSYMAKNPETLLKSKHFETLALISGFNLLDIQDKYEYHFKKEIGGEFIKNTAPPHPTRSTHESYVNSQQQTFSKPTQKPQENVNAQIIQHRKKIANAMTGIRNNIIEIIRFCLANNDFIALSEKRLNNFILIEEPIPVLPDILKILFSLKEQATQITYESFLEMLDTEYKTSGNYQDIKNILLQTPQLKKPLPNIDHTVLLKEFLKMVGHVNDLFYVFKVEKISMDITLECLSPTPNAEKLSKLREILVQTKNKNNV
jgi:DNA primase